MDKRYTKVISMILFLFGVILLLNSEFTISGAFIGTYITYVYSNIIGVLFIFASLILFITSESLEKRIDKEHHWKRYTPNKDCIINDIEQEYLHPREVNKPTPLQERIERAVTKRGLINEKNKRRTYEEQFYEGHASQGGRVIDVESHIAKYGKDSGKLMHFGQPANARYIWIVDENRDFILGNKQTYHHDMHQMKQGKIDYQHRLHKLPHATLARGRKVYGSGEVLVEGGLIKAYNTASGHYIDLKDIEGFNNQGKDVFEYFRKKVGWKEAEGGAAFKFKK